MDPVLPIFWNLPAPQVLEQLSSAPQGLSATQAETALARFGPNELRPTDRLSGLRLLLKQFASPITLILIAGAILSLFLGDMADATIICTRRPRVGEMRDRKLPIGSMSRSS